MENNIEKNVEQNEELIVENEQRPAIEEKQIASKKTFPIWAIPLAIAIVIAIAMMIILPNLSGDNNNDNNGPVYVDYSVQIVDGIGTPVSNVMVAFTTPDGEVKTRVTDKSGLASLKNVLAGEYKVKIEQGYSEVVILQSNYTLTSELTTIKIVVQDEAKTKDIYGDIADDSFAYDIAVGSYTIPCYADQTTYYIFQAVTTGVYKVTLTSTDEKMTVGYYGIPMFVQSTHRGEAEYDGRSFELVIQDNATPYVLGITATKDADANLVIERIGDPPFDPQFAPWTSVHATENFVECTLPAGSVLTDINVTDPSLSVTLGADGYYYTSDGKLVYLRINSIPKAQYLDVSIAFIAGLVDQNFGQNFGGYVYDDNGNFVGKYSYNDMLAKYYEYIDENGVYPLTAELAEAIKVHGNSTGWWNPTAANYLFTGVNVVKENAWLFLCCTAN